MMVVKTPKHRHGRFKYPLEYPLEYAHEYSLEYQVMADTTRMVAEANRYNFRPMVLTGEGGLKPAVPYCQPPSLAEVHRYARENPGCNVGIWVGEGAGICVVEVMGELGRRNWGRLAAGVATAAVCSPSYSGLMGAPWPPSCSGPTGSPLPPSGIIRYLFRCDNPRLGRPGSPAIAPSMYPGVVLRVGCSFVVYPGSVCPKTGGRYEWAVSPGETPLAPLPELLAQYLGGSPAVSECGGRDGVPTPDGGRSSGSAGSSNAETRPFTGKVRSQSAAFALEMAAEQRGVLLELAEQFGVPRDRAVELLTQYPGGRMTRKTRREEDPELGWLYRVYLRCYYRENKARSIALNRRNQRLARGWSEAEAAAPPGVRPGGRPRLPIETPAQ